MRKVAYFKGRIIADEPVKNLGDFDELVEFSNRIANKKNLTYNNLTKTEYYVCFTPDQDSEVAV